MDGLLRNSTGVFLRNASGVYVRANTGDPCICCNADDNSSSSESTDNSCVGGTPLCGRSTLVCTAVPRDQCWPQGVRSTYRVVFTGASVTVNILPGQGFTPCRGNGAWAYGGRTKDVKTREIYVGHISDPCNPQHRRPEYDHVGVQGSVSWCIDCRNDTWTVIGLMETGDAHPGLGGAITGRATGSFPIPSSVTLTDIRPTIATDPNDLWYNSYYDSATMEVTGISLYPCEPDQSSASDESASTQSWSSDSSSGSSHSSSSSSSSSSSDGIGGPPPGDPPPGGCCPGGYVVDISGTDTTPGAPVPDCLTLYIEGAQLLSCIGGYCYDDGQFNVVVAIDIDGCPIEGTYPVSVTPADGCTYTATVTCQL